MSKRVTLKVSDTAYEYLRERAFNERLTMSQIADKIISDDAYANRQQKLFPVQSELVAFEIDHKDLNPFKRCIAELSAVLNG